MRACCVNLMADVCRECDVMCVEEICVVLA